MQQQNNKTPWEKNNSFCKITVMGDKVSFKG